MAYFEPGTLIIKGDVRRAYNLQAPVEQVYEYLSNMRNLLSQVPNTQKLQIGKLSGKARMFLSIETFGVMVDGVIDVEPTYDRPNFIIRLKTPAEPIAAIPPRLLNGTFQGYIKVAPHTERGGSKVSSRIVLAFDAAQVEILNLLPRSIIETSGPALLQEYSENLCDEYISNLLRSFRQWQTEQKRQTGA